MHYEVDTGTLEEQGRRYSIHDGGKLQSEVRKTRPDLLLGLLLNGHSLLIKVNKGDERVGDGGGERNR